MIFTQIFLRKCASILYCRGWLIAWGVTTSSSLFSCRQSGLSTTLSHGFSRIFNRTWQTRFGEIA